MTAPPHGASPWRLAHVDGPSIPLIGAGRCRADPARVDLWDSWPLAHEDRPHRAGSVAASSGSSSARQARSGPGAMMPPSDPATSLGADGWRDHGNALDQAISPGTREWAGSAVLHDDGTSVTLFFTAAGRRGEKPFVRAAPVRGARPAVPMAPAGGNPRPRSLRPMASAMSARRKAKGAPGSIKAFRDPAWFRDPATGQCHILFTASAGWDDDEFNGVIGLATRDAAGRWHPGDPSRRSASTTSWNARTSWSAKRAITCSGPPSRTFKLGTPNGPNGLYAMVADRLAGPWHPVNGDGLVAGNPAAEPTQAFPGSPAKAGCGASSITGAWPDAALTSTRSCCASSSAAPRRRSSRWPLPATA